MLYTVRDMYPDKFQYLSTNFIDKLTGNSYVREGKYTLEELFAIVDKESSEFKSDIEKYRIYVPASTINNVPVITANDKTLKLNENFDPLKDVTAYDEEDGDLTSYIKVVENTVDTSKAGEYVVNYSVSDSNGASTSKKINVTVKEDNSTPKPDDNNNKPEEPSKPDDNNKPGESPKPNDNNSKPNNNSGSLPQTGSTVNSSLLLIVISLFMIYMGKGFLGDKSKKAVDKK